MSRKWTRRENGLQRRIEFLEGLVETRNETILRINDEKQKMFLDRNLYRDWIMALQDKMVEWIKSGMTANLPWYIRNITETRGAGLP